MLKFYLSDRTMIPTNMPTNRIIIPEENRIGIAKPKISVTILSCFGDRNGDNVASIKPSKKTKTICKYSE